MIKNKKSLNLAAIIFSAVFLIITLLRWPSIDTIDRVFYGFAVAGILIIGIAPLFSKKKMNDQ